MFIDIHWIALFVVALIGLTLIAVADKRWVWVQRGSWLFVFISALCAVLLTFKLIANEFPVAQAYTAVNVAGEKHDIAQRLPGSVKDAPPPSGDSKDAIANTMTALGTVIAAITLILALGTTWFAGKMKAIENLEADMRTQLKKLHDSSALWEQAHGQFQEAKPAVLAWVERHAKSSNRWTNYSQFCTYLETLMIKDENLRKKAFSDLLGILSETDTSKNDTSLLPVKKYTETCHQMHGGTEKEVGLWCRIFSETERAHHRESITTQPDPFY